jgi:glycosyltransferase involved in cell wall biosynthesis
MSKIGIAIITCDRPNYVNNLLSTINPQKFLRFVVNDGEQDLSDIKHAIHTVKTPKPKSGVGVAKNLAIKTLMGIGYDYIFLLEDDIVIKNEEVFEKYIEASKLSGIQHFNFAFHGNDNYLPDGTEAVKMKVEYSKDCAVCLYPNVYGALSFYTKKCIEECGYMDEYYYNALEHVDHTNKIIQKKMHPPFRWFADIADSSKYISEQDSSHSGSTIRKDQSWIQNFHNMADYFTKQNGFDVRNPYTKIANKEEVVQSLKEIKKLWKK